MNVLIAEDDDEHRRQFERAARRQRCEVRSVQTGKEAIELLNEMTFHVLVTDVRMKDADDAGKNVLISAMRVQPEAKVIVVTAYPKDFPEAEARDLGAHAYLNRQDPSYIELEEFSLLLEDAWRTTTGRARGEVSLEAWLETVDGETAVTLEPERPRILRVRLFADEVESPREPKSARGVGTRASSRPSQRVAQRAKPAPFELSVLTNGADVEPSRLVVVPNARREEAAKFQVTPLSAGNLVIEVALLLRGEAVGRIRFEFPVRPKGASGEVGG